MFKESTGSVPKFPPGHVKKEGGGQSLPSSPKSWEHFECTVTL